MTEQTETTDPRQLAAARLSYVAWLQRQAQRRRMVDRPWRDPRQGQGRVLALLKLKPEITQRELTFLLGMSRQASAELLDKLQRQGLISREPSETDRRVMVVRLTEAGQAAEQAGHGGAYDDLLACLTDDEVTQFADYLGRIIDGLEASLGDGLPDAGDDAEPAAPCGPGREYGYGRRGHRGGRGGPGRMHRAWFAGMPVPAPWGPGAPVPPWAAGAPVPPWAPGAPQPGSVPPHPGPVPPPPGGPVPPHLGGPVPPHHAGPVPPHLGGPAPWAPGAPQPGPVPPYPGPVPPAGWPMTPEEWDDNDLPAAGEPTEDEA